MASHVRRTGVALDLGRVAGLNSHAPQNAVAISSANCGKPRALEQGLALLVSYVHAATWLGFDQTFGAKLADSALDRPV